MPTSYNSSDLLSTEDSNIYLNEHDHQTNYNSGTTITDLLSTEDSKIYLYGQERPPVIIQSQIS